ncbi:hypothetical protein [Actinoplanes xinjiangensis]|uniref:Uncharacterized protein n=1 Tax=Actinoplanes xinjiangensis TaxID=512350 RepID=A0A316EAC2_9ACTN|nr:hypothetical protein [Actinoplanes xinjiangensis]PWK26289.1 hypothetical protein BC793_1657 [Actinoplanes xinjiangensis]GIF45413.1 hypothetical protein Axi01nite_97240 [Actinoplanes xinjiangensis]
MVAQRDFDTLSPGSGHDNAASYAVLYGTGDESIDWLRAGEALSAVWLTATAYGVSLMPMSGPASKCRSPVTSSTGCSAKSVTRT